MTSIAYHSGLSRKTIHNWRYGHGFPQSRDKLDLLIYVGLMFLSDAQLEGHGVVVD